MWRREFTESSRLALPLVLAQLAQMSMTFVDTLMVGRLGSGPLAAAALGNSTFFPFMIMGLGVVAAVSPMVSQNFGARREKAVGPVVRQGLWVSLAIWPLCLLGFYGAPSLMLWMGQEVETVVETQGYLWALQWGTWPMLAFGALRNFVEAVSRPRLVMGITLGGVALNAMANYVLMYGKLGFPAMGLVGCGWASTAVFWGMLLALVCGIQANLDLSRFRVLARGWIGFPQLSLLKEFLRLGLPIGITHGLEVTFFATTAHLMGFFGTTALASHQIAIQCAAFTFMVPLGIGLATAVRVGQAAGRKDPEAARRAGYIGIIQGTTFMALAALVLRFFPTAVTALFVDLNRPENRLLVEQTGELLGIAAIFQIVDGLQVTAISALRGLKDTRVPMLLALFSYWGIGFSTGCYLAFVGGLEARGLWWGLVLGLGVAALTLSIRFARKFRL